LAPRAPAKIVLFGLPTGDLTVTRVKNASGWASTFTSRWITPGLVNYRDIKGGVGYVSREAIDRSMQSMVGRPLLIKHEPVSRVTGKKLDPVKPENMEEVACGYVSRVWWGDDGWAWLEGTCHDDEAKILARPVDQGGKGWKVSCCYAAIPPLGPAGNLNGMPYDFEIKQFSGEHLALHPSPRYDGATIIMNARTGATAMSFKLFGTKKTEPTAADQAAAKAAADKAAEDARLAEAERLKNAAADKPTEVSPDTKVQIDDKVTATIGEMADSHLKILNGLELDPEQEVEYAKGKNGESKRAKMGHILNCFKQAMEEDEKEEERKKNAEDEEKRKKDEELKNGSGSGGMGTQTLKVEGRPGFSFAPKNGTPDTGTGDRHPNVLRLVHAADAANQRMILKNAGRTPETQAKRIERAVARWGHPSKGAAPAGKN
jgi:hypothetical protein